MHKFAELVAVGKDLENVFFSVTWVGKCPQWPPQGAQPLFSE